MSISENYLINAVDMHNNKNNTIPTFNTELRLYEKGINYRRKGIQLLSFGGALTVGGVVGGVYAYQDYIEYSNKLTKDKIGLAILPTVGIAGIGMTIVGLNRISKSKTFMRSAVNSYNSNINKSAGIEYDFGFTGNGAGMVVRF